jgi:hypothetical protein
MSKPASHAGYLQGDAVRHFRPTPVINGLDSAKHPLHIPPTVHLPGELLTRMDYACRVAHRRAALKGASVLGSAIAAPPVLASLRDGFAALDRFPPAGSSSTRKPIAELSASISRPFNHNLQVFIYRYYLIFTDHQIRHLQPKSSLVKAL